MPDSLKKGAVGQEVRQLQELLIEKGYPVVVDGDFGNQTYRAVRAFQAQNLDQHGQPLVVDGKVGPLTWWSLNHAKVFIELPVPVDFTQMPAIEEGGSDLGRKALELAISEMNAGAREIGGNNQGPYVEKYLNSIAPAGSSWCAALVSWCFSQVDGEMPFSYTLGARDMLRQLKESGKTHPPGSSYVPKPGDIVVWWRERLAGWKGHVGFVFQVKDGMLYTIEGNKSDRVQGFSYVLSRMEKLLGYGDLDKE